VLIVDGLATGEQAASNRCLSISALMRVEGCRRTEGLVVVVYRRLCLSVSAVVPGGGHLPTKPEQQI